MTTEPQNFPPANPLLGHALAYYADRRTMNNPKGWDHVLRVLNHAIESGALEATQTQIDEARYVLHRLAANEAATGVQG